MVMDADPLEQAVHVPELQAHVLGAQAAAAAAAHAQALAQQQQLAQQANNGGSHAGSSGRSAPSGVSGAAGTEANPCKLFVGRLSWQTSSEKLREYFGFFGPVTDVLVMKDPITQRSRGFGFVTFQEAVSAQNVLRMPVHTLDGVIIVPEHATPGNRPKQPNRAKKIFVGGVSQDTSADEVKAYFGQYGTVEETVMPVDQQTKRHRGFGFVTFVNEKSVDSVCEIHFHTVKNKMVACRRVRPKEAVGSQVGLVVHPTRGYTRYAPYAVPARAPAAVPAPVPAAVPAPLPAAVPVPAPAPAAVPAPAPAAVQAPAPAAVPAPAPAAVQAPAPAAVPAPAPAAVPGPAPAAVAAPAPAAVAAPAPAAVPAPTLSQYNQGAGHGQSEQVSCEICNKTYKNLTCKNRHKKLLHGMEIHRCTICRKEFKCSMYLKNHIKHVHHGKFYECVICNKRYKSRSALQYHVSTVHR